MTIQKRLKNGLKFASIALMAIAFLCSFTAYIFLIANAISQGDNLKAFLIFIVGFVSAIFTIGFMQND